MLIILVFCLVISASCDKFQAPNVESQATQVLKSTDSDLVEKIKDDIDSLLDRLCVEFTRYYDTVVNNSRNYDQLAVVLRRESDLYQPFDFNQSSILENQLDWFVDVLVANKATPYLRSTIETIRNRTSNLNAMEVKPNESWRTKVKSLALYVQDLADWFDFLMSVFDQMAHNDFQSKKTTVRFDALKHWPMFKSFALDNLQLPAIFSVERKTSLKSHEQKSLEDVLHALLDPAEGRILFASPETCELKIEGHFVRMSDVDKFAPLCGGRHITAVYLFGQYAVFIDSSYFKMGSEILLGVLAPKWIVIGSQQITLSGFSGRILPQSNTGDGRAGYPGEPSGTFFGVGSDFINSSSLQIFANGGMGGNGQMGMNGTNGHGDVEPIKIHHRACAKNLYSASCARRNVNFDVGRIQYKMEQTKCSRSCSVCCPVYTVKFTIVDGPGPTKGFNGGKQGLGGRRSTSCQIIDLTETSKVELQNDDGLLGSEGRGGKGGLGAVKNGVYSPDISLKCFGATPTGMKSCRRAHVIPGTRAKSAEDGLTNTSGIQIVPIPAKDHETYPIISKYRLFLVNLWSRNKRRVNNVDQEFVDRISVSPEITKSIDLFTLTLEFLALEELREQHPGSSVWLSTLDLLLQSVEAASQSQTNSNSKSFVVVARYLGAAILSKKLGIEYQSDKNLIVDLRQFLNEVSNQIEMLKRLDQRARLKALKTIFDLDIITKQQQADQFLKQQFTEDLELVESRIEASIESLITDVTNLMTELESDRHKYVAKIKTAQIKFGVNLVFKLLNVVSYFVKMAGPIGTVVGLVLDAGITFGQKFTQPGSGTLPNTEIPAAIDALEAVNLQLEIDNKVKIQLLETSFNNVTSANPMEQRLLDKAKIEVAELVGKTNRFSTVQAELSATIENLRRDNHILDSDLLDKVQTVIFLTRPDDITAYEKLHLEIKQSAKTRSSLMEIKELKQGLKQVDANIKKVSAYERFIEDSLSVYLRNLTELMVSVKNGARQSSAITLEISRYNIQKILQEVRTMINKYTVGFGANEDLIICIDMLDNLMRTTINVYDQLQRHNDQLNLGDLIAGIHEAGFTGLLTNEARLDVAILQLDRSLVFSTIQNQYVRAVQTFQQLVFPFAPLFLPAFQISEIGLSSTKDEEVMQLLISKIANLQSIINDMRSSVINGYDDQLFSFNFDEKHPFFAWNEDQHEQKIIALLRGDEVTFKANVANSVANALKFNDIRLKFVATNASYQNDLDTRLKLSNVRLTHTGNSYYKCGDRQYVISHQLQVIEMSVATDNIGEPVSSNVVYKKIRAGDILLSPYTLWKIQVVDCFRGHLDLDHLIGRVQLKLIGKGQYIKGSNPICNQSLDHYYQLD